MRLGTARWTESGRERKALVAPLTSDPSILVDLNRIEQVRLAKLGEGAPETLANVLVPSSLIQVLESGPRALRRTTQALAYAEKWQGRSSLPEFVARPVDSVELLPCLPKPTSIRSADGAPRNRDRVTGPSATVMHVPRPSMAALGTGRGNPGGFCLALEDGEQTVIGAWMVLEWPAGGHLRLDLNDRHMSIPFSTWEEVPWPSLSAGEVMVFPAPILRSPGAHTGGGICQISTPFETLSLVLGEDTAHGTVQ